MYAFIDDVKVEAGLQGNLYIRKEDIEGKIDDASAIIDSYLGGLYPLPFDKDSQGSTIDAPPLIKRLATKLAAAYLLQMDYGPMSPGDAKDGASKEQRVIDTLEKIQNSTIVLHDSQGQSLLSKNNMNTQFIPNDTTGEVIAESIPGQPGGTLRSDQPYVEIERKW
jgi:phage gp36-like protein